MFFHVNIFAGWFRVGYVTGTSFVVVVIRFLLFLCIINDLECKRYFSFSCGFDVMFLCFCIRDSLLLLCMIREKNVNGVQVFKKIIIRSYSTPVRNKKWKT